MRTFSLIAGCAVVVFLGGAMLQEWEVFAQPWFASPQAGPSLSEQDRKAAADTVYLFLKVSSHLYGMRGDSRFADRIPASAEMIAEIKKEIRYLDHLQLVEDPVLQRLEIISIDSQSEDQARVGTREFWVRRRYAAGNPTPVATESDIIRVRYQLRKDKGTWQVVAWEPAADTDPEGPAS